MKKLLITMLVLFLPAVLMADKLIDVEIKHTIEPTVSIAALYNYEANKNQPTIQCEINVDGIVGRKHRDSAPSYIIRVYETSFGPEFMIILGRAGPTPFDPNIILFTYPGQDDVVEFMFQIDERNGGVISKEPDQVTEAYIYQLSRKQFKQFMNFIGNNQFVEVWVHSINNNVKNDFTHYKPDNACFKLINKYITEME